MKNKKFSFANVFIVSVVLALVLLNAIFAFSLMFVKGTVLDLSIKIGMSILMFIVVLVLYFFTMYCYNKLKPSQKKLAVFFLIFVSVSIRSSCLIYSALKTQSDIQINNAFILSVLYQVFGGLTFESGVDLTNLGNSIADNFIIISYYGIFIYAAIVFYSIVTITLDYPFACKIKLIKARRQKRDVYIFNSITRENLILAKNIKEKYKKNRAEYLNNNMTKKCNIVFFGIGVDKFDRKNTLHEEIKSNNYLYIDTYNEDDDNEDAFSKSIIHKFKKKKINIHYFAFEVNSDETNQENDLINKDSVFYELKQLHAESQKSSVKNKINIQNINFYILTLEDIEYIAYDNWFLKLKKQFPTSINDKICLNVINEALICTRKLNAVEQNDHNNNTKTKVLCFGYGLTGQKAIHSLYINNVRFYNENGDKKAQELGFVANIVDKEFLSKVGLYKNQHPLFLINSYPADADLEKAFQDKREVKVPSGQTYTDEVINSYKAYSNSKAFENEIKRIINYLPYFNIHQNDCFSEKIVNYLDAHTGIDVQEKNKQNNNKKNKLIYDAIVIAMGDDKKNIQFFNSLILDIKREIKFHNIDNKHKTRIFVHIRDYRQDEVMVYVQNDKLLNNYVEVIVFGNKEDIYTYDNIIDQNNAKILITLYNRPYLPLMTDNAKEIEEQAWIKETLFKKESNKYCADFCHNYKCIDKDEVASTEHNRWVRFHIVNGYMMWCDKIDRDQREQYKLHNLLHWYKASDKQNNTIYHYASRLIRLRYLYNKLANFDKKINKYFNDFKPTDKSVVELGNYITKLTNKNQISKEYTKYKEEIVGLCNELKIGIRSSKKARKFMNKYDNTAMAFWYEYPLSKVLEIKLNQESDTNKSASENIDVVFWGNGSNIEYLFKHCVSSAVLFDTIDSKFVENKINYYFVDADKKLKNSINNTIGRTLKQLNSLNQQEYLPLPSGISYQFLDSTNNIHFPNKGMIIIDYDDDKKSFDIVEKIAKNTDMKIVVLCKKDNVPEIKGKSNVEVFVCKEDYQQIHKIQAMAISRNMLYDLEKTIVTSPNIDINKIFNKAKANWENLDNAKKLSNMTACVALRLKLNLLGLDISDGKGIKYEIYRKIYDKEKTIEKEKTIQYTSKDTKHIVIYDLTNKSGNRINFAMQEHIRWNNYMLIQGYLPCPKAQIGIISKDIMNKKKMHACLTTFEGLEEYRKRMAEVNTSSEEQEDVIKYDYQIMDEAYYILNYCGLSIVKNK